MLPTNNILEQAQNNYKLNIILLSVDDWAKELEDTKHNVFRVTDLKNLNLLLGYNFMLIKNIPNNLIALLKVSASAHLPLCIYQEDKMEIGDNITKKQVKNMLQNMVIIFKDKEIQKEWKNIVDSQYVFEDWDTVLSIMKDKVYI